MVERQFPNPGEIFELMRFKKPELDGRKRRLAAALTIYDMTKALDKSIVIRAIQLESKSGGKSGGYQRSAT